MRKCEDCKLILEDTVRFCPKCGQSAEAAVWHKIGADLAPENPDLAVKVKRADAAPAGATSLGIRRWARLPVTWAIAVGLVALVIASVAVGRWSAREPARRAARTTPRQPVKIVSPSAAPGKQAVQAGEEQRVRAPLDFSQQAGQHALRTSAESMIQREAADSEEVVNAGAEVDDVVADPRQKVATITFSMRGSMPLTKHGILVAAAAIARAAFAANAELDYVTARCVAHPAGSASTQIAFVGDTARATIQTLPDKPDDQQLAAAFGNQWWNPGIR